MISLFTFLFTVVAYYFMTDIKQRLGRSSRNRVKITPSKRKGMNERIERAFRFFPNRAQNREQSNRHCIATKQHKKVSFDLCT